MSKHGMTEKGKSANNGGGRKRGERDTFWEKNSTYLLGKDHYLGRTEKGEFYTRNKIVFGVPLIVHTVTQGRFG